MKIKVASTINTALLLFLRTNEDYLLKRKMGNNGDVVETTSLERNGVL